MGHVFPLIPVCQLPVLPGLNVSRGRVYLFITLSAAAVVVLGNGLPLQRSSIKLEHDGAIWATTDARGDFYVEVPKTSRLIFEKSGYETVVSEEVLESHTGWLIEMVDILCVDVPVLRDMYVIMGVVSKLILVPT
jgi:hypothetical protein